MKRMLAAVLYCSWSVQMLMLSKQHKARRYGSTAPPQPGKVVLFIRSAVSLIVLRRWRRDSFSDCALHLVSMSLVTRKLQPAVNQLLLQSIKDSRRT